MVGERTTSSPEGCRISHGQCLEINRMDQILFPYPEDNSLRKNIEKLLSHLERGVILWMAHDGIYAKRLCQSRIYWEGPLSMYTDRPNKLERDVPCKLFDTQQFLTGKFVCITLKILNNVEKLIIDQYKPTYFFGLYCKLLHKMSHTLYLHTFGRLSRTRADIFVSFLLPWR